MTENSHVGPIIFSHNRARSQLEEEGCVVTFRGTQRTTGETWWRDSRTGPKRGDVIVEEIGEVEATDKAVLRPYATAAGFDSVEEWQQAIRELNGNLPRGYLYTGRRNC